PSPTTSLHPHLPPQCYAPHRLALDPRHTHTHSSLILPPHPNSPLFPYTTLFRSQPLPSCTASTSERKYCREPRGSVNPTITASWPWLALTFNHSRVRRPE